MDTVSWLALAAVVSLILGMLAHLTMWSVAGNVRRIAEALELVAEQNHRRHNGTNGVREYLE